MHADNPPPPLLCIQREIPRTKKSFFNIVKSHLRHGRSHRICLWGPVRSRAGRRAQRRYLGLIHYALTVFDAADKDPDLFIHEKMLVGGLFSFAKRRRKMVVGFPTEKFSVVLRAGRKCDAWSIALTEIVRVVNIFYKIVRMRELGSYDFFAV